MRVIDFIFDCVNLLYYKCYKINFKRGSSYIDSSDRIKKSIINHKNNYHKCFQYAATTALNFDEIKKGPQRVLNIKPFINNFNWEGMNYPSKI